MGRPICALVVSVLATLGASEVCSAAAAEDEVSIRQVQSEQEAAWNRHDAAAYANLFTENGDVVNVLGWWWQGRPLIQNRLASAFASAFRDSKLTVTDVQVRFITATIVVAHVRWTMTGAKMPPGVPQPREGIEMQILRKQAGRWLIESFQNTNGSPERAFPGGPLPSVSPQ
jgi:uncharacterized protein (TIGR02246 family)